MRVNEEGWEGKGMVGKGERRRWGICGGDREREKGAVRKGGRRGVW